MASGWNVDACSDDRRASGFDGVDFSMKSRRLEIGLLVSMLLPLMLGGCNGRVDAAAEAPPPANVVSDVDLSRFTVDHPEQFPLAAASAHPTASELVVTGTVTPDISRNVPVVSLASGRVMAINARLGDTVKKGQLLLTIRSDDVAGGFSDYRKAVADEVLARAQLERASDLYKQGAIALNDLQVAQDMEDKAQVDLETTEEHLRLLGNDPHKPMGMVDIFAPVSGVITDQQVTNAAAVQAFSTPSPFTISDLSSVWIVCDRRSGLSATCTRTTWPASALGIQPKSLSMHIPVARSGGAATLARFWIQVFAPPRFG
jgi:membrane fusion protein, heavy metal efflux system